MCLHYLIYLRPSLTCVYLATAIVQVQKATLVGENDQPIEMEKIPDNREFWETSVGKFWFSFGELPQQLQYCHQILKVTIVILYL